MKKEKEQIDWESCNEVQERNYLYTEYRIAKVRWYIIAFLFLYVNLLPLPGWPVGLLNGILAATALYNLGIVLALRKARRFSIGLALLFRYLDTLAVAIALFFSGGVNSPLLFIWYITLFGAGVRLGFPGSLALQVPMALIYLFLWFSDPAMQGLEGMNRLAIGLFSVAVVPLSGIAIGREEQYTFRLMADIRKDSITDRLTGLFNYSYFIDELHREQARAERTGSHFSLILFDLDLFKQVNDTYGHEKGNLLLKAVAGILMANARKMDMVARYGGEEFVILMPESNGAEMEAAERIRRKIEEAEFSGIAERPLRITISGGVCTYPRDAVSVNELLDKADKGLYVAKTCGRNRTSYCEPMGT
ncbi:MAG: hypothetical protein A2078_13640 [Nitrospirae bacterium GWC2_57_9]|nr:MAG: hypothetical protein A2078_13640 [Nitrospirae bacterium GWC2_57_9]